MDTLRRAGLLHVAAGEAMLFAGHFQDHAMRRRGSFSSRPLPARRCRRALLRRPGVLYFCAVVREFRWTLLLLAAAIVWGAVLYRMTPHEELGWARPTVVQSLFGAWMALLAQPVFSPPGTWYLTAMCAVYPIVGALLIGEGVVRFALLMFSRRHGEKEWMRVLAATYHEHIVLCGLGNLGFRVLEQLVASGVPVVAIEKDGDGRFVAAAKAMNVPVLICDMKQDQSLLEAGIDHARAVICCTNDDMANLEVAIDARRYNPAIRVVLRVFDQQVAGKIASAMMIDAAFSAAALAAPTVAAMSLESSVTPSATIDGVPHVTAELSVSGGGELAGRSIEQIERAQRLRVLAHTPAGGPVQSPPDMQAVVGAGDRLLVHLPGSRLAELCGACRGAVEVG